MYAKIYKYVFIRDLSNKELLPSGFWKVTIDDIDYILKVFNDTSPIVTEADGKKIYPQNEAELVHFGLSQMDVVERVKINKAFLDKLIDLYQKRSLAYSKNKEKTVVQPNNTMIKVKQISLPLS